MERVQFLKAIQEVYRADPSEGIPVSLLQAKNQLTKFQWTFLKGIIQDRKRILELFPKNRIGKKGGISGARVPITVKILNRRDKNPALQKFIGNDNTWLVIYFGISPEIENFVSVVMWPSKSQASQLCYSTIYETLDEEDSAILLEGAYNLQPPNEIHPQMAQRMLVHKDTRPFYDWRYFPFIKDVGDSLSWRISPVNYRSVLLRDEKGALIEDYVTVRVIAGSVIDLQGDEILLKLPFLEDRHHPFTFRINPANNTDPPRKGSLYYWLLLERAGERLPEVFMFEQAQRVDALAHMLSFWLYDTFVNSVDAEAYRKYMVSKYTALGRIKPKEMSDFFGICTLQEFKEHFYEYSTKIFDEIYGNIEKRDEEPPRYLLSDLICSTCLSPYFKLDELNNMIYYVPPIFHHELLREDFLSEKILHINKITHRYLSH